MKHGIAFRKLGRTSSHRDIMLRNLVSSLLEHGQIKTTVAKAKETARLAEKMITLGKRGDDWARKSAQAFLFKHEITLPRLFDEYANRYAERPGGYTRIHFHGNRIGDNAPHAIIELVDGPQDLRFQMTARAVGRETADQLTTSAAASGPSLRPLTKLNMQKVLRYRSEEDKQHFRQIAAQWANRTIAEPQATEGLRHPVKRIHVSAAAEAQKKEANSSSTDGPTQQRFKYAYETPEGRTLRAGERLVGIAPSRGTSPLALARGQLGHPRRQGEAKHARSALWEQATMRAVDAQKARGGQPIPNTPS